MERRVLLIWSINDKLSRDRARAMNNSLHLAGLIVEHCYALDFTIWNRVTAKINVLLDLLEGIIRLPWLSALQKAELVNWLLRGRPLSCEKLEKTLQVKIRDFKPDAIMLHTGVVFQRYPQIFIQVLDKVKSEYPHIKIGFEYRHPLGEYLAKYSVFDSDEVTHEIEFRLFGRNSPI